MSDIRTITFTATKGGSGTSTIAAITALTSGVRTLLVDQSQSHDLVYVLGLVPNKAILEVNNSVDLAIGDDYDTDGYELVVIDRGLNAKPVDGAENLIVTRKCYLSLRAANASRSRYDGVVIVDETERALTISDVKHVLGLPVVAVVPYDNRISRSVDAGMLASRADQYAEYLKDVVKASVTA
jgi:septum formation inhibitor-activating ATPase MinD